MSNNGGATLKGARIDVRVGTDEQDLTRQITVVQRTWAAGIYAAGTEQEKASGARADRTECCCA